jgi:SAM-dependent methyltransferase
MNVWNERFSQKEYLYGREPNEFIREHADRIPGQTVLCLAEGEGRNAVFLAGLGHRVLAVDKADAGLKKARDLADSRGVSIETEAADLATYDPGRERWDGIISTFVHLPRDIRARCHARVVSALKPGGVFLLEAYSPRQGDMPGKGGPPPSSGMLMRLEEVAEELSGLDFFIAREIERDVNEGTGHRGLSAVIQILAIKPGT